jgi:hypothetical protein
MVTAGVHPVKKCRLQNRMGLRQLWPLSSEKLTERQCHICAMKEEGRTIREIRELITDIPDPNRGGAPIGQLSTSCIHSCIPILALFVGKMALLGHLAGSRNRSTSLSEGPSLKVIGCPGLPYSCAWCAPDKIRFLSPSRRLSSRRSKLEIAVILPEQRENFLPNKSISIAHNVTSTRSATRSIPTLYHSRFWSNWCSTAHMLFASGWCMRSGMEEGKSSGTRQIQRCSFRRTGGKRITHSEKWWSALKYPQFPSDSIAHYDSQWFS